MKNFYKLITFILLVCKCFFIPTAVSASKDVISLTPVVEDYQVNLTLAVAHLEGLSRDQAMVLLALCAYDFKKKKSDGVSFNLSNYAYWANEYCNFIKDKGIISLKFSDLDKLRLSDELNLNQCRYVLDHVADYKNILY